MKITNPDKLADVVIERFRRSLAMRSNEGRFHNKSFEKRLRDNKSSWEMKYTACQRRKFKEDFGVEPTRFYGLSNIKVRNAAAWKTDLVISNLDSVFTVAPSPEPTLDPDTIARIREEVTNRLTKRMEDSGIIDASLLVDQNGKPLSEVADFLKQQASIVKKIEIQRINATALDAANKAERRMRDRMVEGDFRQAYGNFTHSQMCYGLGWMRFPENRLIPVIKHSNGKVIRSLEVRPMFRAPNIHDMYPVADGATTQDCTAIIECMTVSKMQLINFAKTKGYIKEAILDVLEAYEEGDRNWLQLEGHAHLTGNYWGPDEVIPILIHEGFLSGRDLKDYKIRGVEDTEYVNATVIVCGNRVIRCEVGKHPQNARRSYYATPYKKFGDSLFDVVGVTDLVLDAEERVNRLFYAWEHNISWSTMPPIMKNPGVLFNPTAFIEPGGQYDVEDSYAANGVMPEAVRAMNAVSAQYQLLMAQIAQVLRLADDESGIPSFAYGAQDLGRASLGEYSQRMSSALRSIKAAALEEDVWFIEPMGEHLFEQVMLEDPELTEGQDVNLQVRGITGLLDKDLREQRRGQLLPLLLNLEASGKVPEAAVKYGIREILEGAGWPVDSLGLDDPTISTAIAEAKSTPVQQFGGSGPMVPTVDGRSTGVPNANVAAPSGAQDYNALGMARATSTIGQ